MPYHSGPFCCSVDFRDYGRSAATFEALACRVKNSTASAREISHAISRSRPYLEDRLLANFHKSEKTRIEIDANRENLPEYIREKISPLISYLIQYFRTTDEVWLFLYAGEALRLVEDLSRPAGEGELEIDNLLQRNQCLFVRFLSRRIGAASIILFQEVLDVIAAMTRSRSTQELRILFAGDCLFTDVLDFLRPKCARDGISILPVRITSKNPGETREQLIKCSNEKFDAVFMSPFTYENSREYAVLLSWKGRGLKGNEFNELVNEIIRQVHDTIDVAASYYDCPIFVHNCGGFRRWENNLLVAAVKSVGTSRTRHAARDAINPWLYSYVQDKNASTFDHIFVLEESSLVAAFGERTVGRYIFEGGDLHTAVFGEVLAEFYHDIVLAVSHLKNKKLIVCDLDNTLWKGTIGEAAVTPLVDRQERLQELKKKGILLAICSKNNSSDVSWNGNLLGPSDFVASRMNWEPKPHNVESIEQELRLKRKDFVFLDDSALERDLVAARFPEIVTLNPEEARTWRLIQLWGTLMGRGATEDRTAHYQNEKKRSGALESGPHNVDDLSAALSKLQIKVEVREAARSDMQRALELINRTNQFNLCGTKTTFRELQRWLASSEFRIVIAHAEDKFGTMGAVGVSVIQCGPNGSEIPVFVLSCRVIGYGIESAMLNYICIISQNDAARQPIIGRVKLTAHNEPCRQMYRNHGFVQEDEDRWHSNSCEIKVPSWLTIEYAPPSRHFEWQHAS